MIHFTKNNFSLIEVLVAVVVLVIMMGFIFQFSNGAQRLWASNTARTEMAAQADGVFSILAEDLVHLYVVTEDQDIDAQAGWYCMHEEIQGTGNALFTNDKTYTLENLAFFRQEDPGTVASSYIYGVRYHFVPATGDFGEGKGKLYRYEDTTVKQWEKLSYNFWVTKGNVASDYYPDKTPQDEDFLLAENIKSIQIYSDAEKFKDKVTGTIYNATNPIRTYPKFLRVTITFSVPERLRNGQNTTTDTDRTFSRVFFLTKSAL